jgi:hypothetical protein
VSRTPRDRNGSGWITAVELGEVLNYFFHHVNSCSVVYGKKISKVEKNIKDRVVKTNLFLDVVSCHFKDFVLLFFCGVSKTRHIQYR